MVEMVVIGASWGGLQAISQIIGAVPADCSYCIAIAQHRLKHHMGQGLSELLQKKTALKVIEVEHSQPIEPAHLYLAPADYHLLVEAGHFSLSVDEKVHYSRPSIDVLFETAADIYKERCVGILLTGANADGAQGLWRIKQLGGYTIVQNPETAERPEMPQSALNIGAEVQVMDLTQIENYLATINRSNNERQN